MLVKGCLLGRNVNPFSHLSGATRLWLTTQPPPPMPPAPLCRTLPRLTISESGIVRALQQIYTRATGDNDRRSLAAAKTTRSRQGNTSQCYGKPCRISSSRFGCAQRTRESQGTRRPTNGPSSRRRSQTSAGSNNGLVTRTDWGHARCCSRGPSRTSNGRSRRRSGQKTGHCLSRQ